jgi:hypothetical protein
MQISFQLFYPGPKRVNCFWVPGAPQGVKPEKVVFISILKDKIDFGVTKS